jgi:SAM-dependent methyltransferase
MKRLAAPQLRCPLCQGDAKAVLDLNFAEKPWLPDAITLALCESCDFAFTGPADPADYVRYYGANRNDLISSGDAPPPAEQRRYDQQAAFVQALLDQAAPKQVLDIGCGAGGLLRTLRRKFSQHAYHGTDPNLDLDWGMAGIGVSHDWQGLPQSFDLIILSHTLEHLVDLNQITAIGALLAPGGSLYVEVPDAARYAQFPRRENLYYIDRLHINHFTHRSLARLLEIGGLSVTWAGRHDFQYKDGGLYPACCLLATGSPANGRPTQLPAAARLVDALPRYLHDEAHRARIWRQNLRGAPAILVYGFGDNFFRAQNANGPLADLPVRAIVDQRWQTLRQSRHADRYAFVGVAEAVEKYAQLPLVVTVSFGGEAIAEKLRDAGCQHVFVL